MKACEISLGTRLGLAHVIDIVAQRDILYCPHQHSYNSQCLGKC